MEISRLLTIDMRTLAEVVSRAAEWWWAELRGMVPMFRETGTRERPRLIVRHDGEADRYHYHWVSDGCLSDAEPVPMARSAAATLCLPRRLGLMRTVTLPPLSSTDLRRLVVLEIDRLTPFTADQVLIDTAVVSRAPEGVTVAVGVVRRHDANAALRHARARGIAAAGLSLEDAEGRPRFDFLAGVSGGRGHRWSAARLWAVAGGLALGNLLLFTAHDVIALDALRTRVEAVQPRVRVAEKLRETAETEAARRAALLERKRATDPLPLLDSLTRTLPDTVWVQRLDWDGHRLRLTGWSRGVGDVLAVVESDPLLIDARAEEPTAVPEPPFEPFDIVADRDRGAGS